MLHQSWLIKIVEGGEDFINDFNTGNPLIDRNINRENEIRRKIEDYLTLDNSLTQKATQIRLQEDGIEISQPSVSLDLNKIYFTRKRFVKVPMQRNTIDNLAQLTLRIFKNLYLSN